MIDRLTMSFADAGEATLEQLKTEEKRLKKAILSLVIFTAVGVLSSSILGPWDNKFTTSFAILIMAICWGMSLLHFSKPRQFLIAYVIGEAGDLASKEANESLLMSGGLKGYIKVILTLFVAQTLLFLSIALLMLVSDDFAFWIPLAIALITGVMTALYIKEELLSSST